MEPAARRMAFDVTSTLEGAEVGDRHDVLDRPSTMVTVPLEVADPSTGTHLGRLEVKFSFDPDSYAILQIDWRLVEGTLGEFGSQFVDTTVIVTAGRVATIPPLVTTAPATNPSTTTATTTPSSAGGD